MGVTRRLPAVLLFASTDRLPLIGSIVVAALGFCYFVQQQKLAETALFKDLFTEYNRRYDALNDRLAEIVASKAEAEVTELSAKDRQTVVDYFNLCAEEYLFFSEGYIHHAAWQTWCSGMLWYLDREPFRTLWNEECKTNAYYGLSVAVIKRGAPQQRRAADALVRRGTDMSRGPAFTEREVFERMLGEIRAADESEYQDLRTIYGDMSRLVVAWLARTPPDQIIRIYNQLGWIGTANGRALHAAARHWMKTYRPQQPVDEDGVAD